MRSLELLEGEAQLSGSTERRMPQYNRARQTYELILREAEKIIHTEGEANLNIVKLAKNADISPATVYEYFADKGEIIDKLLWRYAAETIDKLKRKVGRGRNVNASFVFSSMLDVLLSLYKEHPALLALAGSDVTEALRRAMSCALETQQILVSHGLIKRANKTTAKKIQLWLVGVSALLRAAFQINVKGDPATIRFARDMAARMATGLPLL
jgi:AcrR family transcriptional regulator